MTDTEKGALCARIDELCAELGQAQLSLDMWHDRAEDMRNRLLVKQAENVKLRELVNDLYFDLLGEMPESMLEDRRLQMHELGVEVGE